VRKGKNTGEAGIVRKGILSFVSKAGAIELTVTRHTLKKLGKGEHGQTRIPLN